MSIFSRIADIFKANVNEALDRAEDPEKMLKQMVLEMEESVNKTTLAVARGIANEKSLFKKLNKAKEEQEDWQEKAKKALLAGREDLAKQALEKKAISERNERDLTPIYLQAKETAEKMKSQLDQLKLKLDEARQRQSTLIARSQSAKAQKLISQSFSGVGSDAFSKFDKYEAKIENFEAEAEAFGHLAGNDKSLEDEFKQLESSNSDAELLKLKAEMGLLESPKNKEE
jgi:phage shock protein A